MVRSEMVQHIDFCGNIVLWQIVGENCVCNISLMVLTTGFERTDRKLFCSGRLRSKELK